MTKHRIHSAPYHSAAAISVHWGAYVFPRGGIAQTIAGTMLDLDRASSLRRAGLKDAARGALGFCRDARLFAPASRLP